MGQLLSSQASQARPQGRKRQGRSHKSRSFHGRQSDLRIDSVQSIPNTTRQDDLNVRHQTESTIDEPVERSRSRHLREIDENSRGLRRSHRHGKGKTSRESLSIKNNGLRVGHADQSKARKKASKKSGLHASKSTIHQNTISKKECVICADIRSLTHFPSRPPTDECNHANDVCRRCLRTWIQSEFLTKVWNEIKCPVCSIRMQYADMQAFAPHDIFRRYDRLSVKAAFEAIPNFRWCTAKGCKSGQVHPPESSKFRCKACKKSHCIHHGSAWHKGETCGEYDYRTNKKLKKQEEIASKRVISETTKKCPGCKSPIQKNYGCDHMSCKFMYEESYQYKYVLTNRLGSKCKHEFCWLCLAPYKGTGFRKIVKHRSACEYYEPDGSDSD